MPEMPYHRSYHRSWILAAERIDDPAIYGLYHLLCMHIYERGGTLEYNPRMLRTLLRCGQVKTIEKTIHQLVNLGLLSISQDNMLTNRKAAKEIAKFAERLAKHPRNFAQTSSETGEKSAANSTRAHDGAQSRYPEDRIRSLSNGEVYGSVAAREQPSLTELVRRRRAELQREENDEQTSDQDGHSGSD